MAPSALDRVMYLSNVIVQAADAIKGDTNKRWVFSTVLDNETHDMLVALGKQLSSSQQNTVKYAIRSLFRSLSK